MSQSFSALQELGDTTRLSVFLAILGVRKNVSQIVTELELAQPQVSYHLRKLKDAGLAVEEKDGRWVWYQANWDTGDRNIRDFIELLARWAGEGGAAEARSSATAGGGTGAEPPAAGVRQAPRADGAGREEPQPVVRPVKKGSEMDDFLL